MTQKREKVAGYGESFGSEKEEEEKKKHYWVSFNGDTECGLQSCNYKVFLTPGVDRASSWISVYFLQMGRATRWFKGLFGLKKEKEQNEMINSNDRNRKDKKRMSFVKSKRDSDEVGQIPATIPVNIPAAEAAWLRSFYSETDNEQNKHAIAVAAATAAAADAAVAAAQAAVAVVRLTSHGRGTMFNGGREKWAAVRIQTVFRGFLARKALTALKGLVKLQAVVRGYLVRKQATATLYSMEALIRAQATVRSQRTRSFSQKDYRFQPDIRSRKSIERFDDARSDYNSSMHSRRLSSSVETSKNNFDESPKIVEIDTYRPKSRSRKTNTSTSDFCESPVPCQIPSRLSIPECRNYQEFDWGFMGDDYKFATAQSTPRFVNSGASNLPVTPAKSVCVDSFFSQYSNFPNYMANTQSFKAKSRSYSAPRQRPEPIPRKKMSLNEMVESRASLSGVKMRKSCSQVQDVLNFKNTVMSKINDGSSEIFREAEREYLQRKW